MKNNYVKSLSCVFALMAIVTTSANASDFNDGKLLYNKTSDNTCEVAMYEQHVADGPYRGDIVIPAKVTNEGVEYSVTSIATKAFYNLPELNSVSIPESVAKIGDNCFQYSYVTTITMQGKMTEIGKLAFANTTKLKSIALPEGITKLNEGLFDCCSVLESVTLPSSLKEIGKAVFQKCDALTAISIPNNVTTIGDSAFLFCPKLESVSIPEGVTKIGGHAFWNCKGLKTINIPASVTKIGSYAFYYCYQIPSITIPNGVTVIDKYTFYTCQGIKTIKIPDNVTEINYSAFSGCTRLESIIIPDKVESIYSYAFSGCKKLTTVTLGKSVSEFDASAFNNCSQLQTITFSSTTPPTINNAKNLDLSEVFKNTTIVVPKGSLEAYKANPAFAKIIDKLSEPNPSSVNEIDCEAVKVHVQNGVIVIDNASAGSTATVTSLSGATIATIVVDETANIEVPAAGLYIVKIGNTVKKVIVK